MFRTLTLLLVSAALALPVFAQKSDAPKTDNPLTIEDVWRPPEFASPTLSRDGKWLAATVPIRGRQNLAVMNIETRETKPLTGYTNYDVQGIRWVGDRILYTLGQNNTPTGPGRFDGGGLFVIHRDGNEARKLSNTVRDARDQGMNVYRALSFHRLIPGNTDEIIAEGNMTDSVSEDLYRLNLRTGKYTLITQGRPAERTFDWIMDNDLVPRVVTANIKDTNTRVVYYRKDANSPWNEIARFDRAKPGAIVPLALEEKSGMLRVASNQGRDTMAIFRFDPINKKLGEQIAAHPRYDMGAHAGGDRIAGGVEVDPDTLEVLGVSVNAAIPERVWLDEKYAATQSALDKALPGRVNTFRRLPNSKKLLISSYSDTQPVVYYLLDEEKRRMEELGASRPWQVGKLPKQVPFIYKTRDGIEIDGYYFLPKDYKPGTKLPTIVHIHGGPFARADTWGQGFGVNEGRLFASRGYAVIVPNFRVTPGLGSKVYYSGFGTYGRQMSDDHEDALKWGIEQGFVDPANVCISGASYGGYAALQAQVRNASLWKCSIAGLAVTDLYYQLTSKDGDIPYSTSAVDYWKAVLGVESLNEPIVKEVSPVHFASKITKPVFLYAGEDDLRVPIAQIGAMARNLRDAGNPPKAYVVKPNEGHGFGKLENNVDLYTQIFAFLKEQFGK
ncbi:MAG: prolyl oligopeptidase family serine peptidase [Burkholderiales bacterium]|nr:prolyl oligopeptidase family serine peptidase [Burkholderiales bacterium]